VNTQHRVLVGELAENSTEHRQRRDIQPGFSVSFRRKLIAADLSRSTSVPSTSFHGVPDHDEPGGRHANFQFKILTKAIFSPPDKELRESQCGVAQVRLRSTFIHARGLSAPPPTKVSFAWLASSVPVRR
jgi:hypothetical protein